ncbi:hypothetical protein KIN20_014326 [Parelaphostrongylus tenuis]|uniref:Uncharacterized protein n=1 Tax=Parelaphostrongylus tenuis TaxID=148309 RepID=A0AAD5N344_PARTN|nr:hypothetical protein KIN20_014326 [Parelaphostrongylus tenuis]
MLNVGNVYIPINENWDIFLKNNDRTSEATKDAGARVLVESARKVLNDLKPDENDEVKVDAWFFDVDWSYKSDNEYPEWYFKLFSKRGNAHYDLEFLTSEHVIMRSSLVPLIFGMIYGPYPLHRSEHHGWGYLVPGNEKVLRSSQNEAVFKTSRSYEHICKVISENMSEFGDIQHSGRAYGFDDFLFYRLPHPQGAQNVGDPLGKHFLRYIESKVLRPTRHKDEFFVLLEALKTTKFWTNYAKRFEAEIPLWYDSSDGSRVGAIAPAIIPAGTVSRRSVHKLWVTLTNESGSDRIGTGIKGLVQAPNGSVLVGADVGFSGTVACRFVWRCKPCKCIS